MTSLRELQTRAGATNAKSGFHQSEHLSEEDKALYWGNKLLLVVSEVTEAHDEIRHGHAITEAYYTYPESLVSEIGLEATKVSFEAKGLLPKPEGAPSEIADAIIRLIGIAEEAGIDIEAAVLEKMDYNDTREYLHGKKF